ncbi:sulfotransferase [uncultured Nostoc sp.]|uniref:sulfotransferase n=1 Tax=uncultured Nostoc sp. TaxID=340711 RepID=UPI0035CBF05F
MSKIFGIGLSRTGTSSCCLAMKNLGIKSIHLPYSWQEIDKHVFSTDTPVSARFEELDKRYPNSKFIYTTRNLDDWVESFLKFMNLDIVKMWPLQLSSEFREWISEGHLNLYDRPNTEIANMTSEELIRAYQKHEERVMTYFENRTSDLLTIDITDARTQPFTKLINFLEFHRLIEFPKVNTFDQIAFFDDKTRNRPG